MIETVDEVVSDVDEIDVETLSGWVCRFNTILPGPLMVRVVGLDVAEQVSPPVQVQLRKL